MEVVLGGQDPVFLPFLYGLTYNLLHDADYPETEMLLWFSGVDRHLFHGDPFYQQAVKVQMQTVRQRLRDNDFNCRTVQAGRRSLIYFDGFVPSLNCRASGHFTMDPLCWAQSELILEYIYHYPWLLPLLRVIVKWAQATGFLVSGKNSFMDGLTMSMMVIDYGLRCGQIHQPIEVDKVHLLTHNSRLSESCDRFQVLTGIRDFGRFAQREVWNDILNRLQEDCSSAAPMGELLLGFFSEQERSALTPVHKSLVNVFGHTCYNQTSTADATHLLQEEMQRAFHKLSFHGSIPPLFEQVETEKVISLSPSSAERMQGSEEFFARLYAKQTDTLIEVHQKGRRDGSLLIKIIGTQTGIFSVEKLLEQFKSNVDARNNTLREYPGVMELFLPDSHKCIIEGIHCLNEKGVTFEDYIGIRYPMDDYRGIYVLRVLHPSEKIPDALYDLSAAKFQEFRNFFVWRLQRICQADKESYSPVLHGSLKLEISYGKFYLICPPKEMMEDPEGISLAQLRDFVDKDAKRYVQQPHRWKKEMENFEWTVPDPAKDYAHSAFYPRVHPRISGTALEHLLREEYGLDEIDRREGYELLLRSRFHSIMAMYDAELCLASAYYPPLHWMTIDVKRFFEERKEMDIRYDLTSQAPYEEPEMLSFLSGILQPKVSQVNGDGSPVVNSEVMPCVEAFKLISQREFKFRGPEMTVFWRCATLVLREMRVKTRPKNTSKIFAMEERVLDLRWIIDLQPIWTISHINDFIGEMWYQVTFLSDKLKDLAKYPPQAN